MGLTKQKHSSTRATDYGPSELAKRFTVVPKLTTSNVYTGKVVDDSEIDRLLFLDRINALEHSLLVALLNRLHRAMFIGLKSPDFNGVAHSDPSRISERKAVAVMGICHIVKAMDKVMGHANRMALINLVLLDVPWPNGLPVLHDCVLTLQDVLGGGQGELKRKQLGKHKLPVGMHAHT